MTEDVT